MSHEYYQELEEVEEDKYEHKNKRAYYKRNI